MIKLIKKLVGASTPTKRKYTRSRSNVYVNTEGFLVKPTKLRTYYDPKS
ncbi:hypothetical protein J2S77_000751 [Alkalibacillus salilacus]|uniref:50S ribosomal protein L33 n=1 Tax=Alkalibacillus salilacus TaxID=284582 RepID=A0ABT9VD60_9BACI|nr:hypothetical protein [Alkalibacillus salilacus]